MKVRDLDAVNQRYGRTLGDLLLKDLAACLYASGKFSDIVGRLGGAEFRAVLVGCSRDEGASYFCKALSGRLSEQLRRRELDADIVAGVSVGTRKRSECLRPDRSARGTWRSAVPAEW